MTASSQPATLIATHVVRPDKMDAFRRWAEALADDARSAAGHQAGLWIEQPGGIHHLVQQFGDRAALDHWRASDAHRRLLAEGREQFLQRAQLVDGRTARIMVPGEAAATKWKQFITTWLAVLPVLLLVNLGMSALPVELPKVAQLMISSVLLTGLLTWVILPRVRAWTRTWLLEDGNGRAQM